MQNIQYGKTCPRNEKGIVLVVVLLLTAVLVLLGSTAVIMSTTDLKISGNYQRSSKAFYNAEAGVETVLAYLRTNSVTYPTADALSTDIDANATCPSETCTAIPVPPPTGFSSYNFYSHTEGNNVVYIYGKNVAERTYVFRMTGRDNDNPNDSRRASRTIEIYIQKNSSIPAGCLAAVTTNYNVGILGTIVVDGRDHNINGGLIAGATTGKYGVSAFGTFNQGGNGSVGGTSAPPTPANYAPTTKTYQPSIVQNRSPLTPPWRPLTPDEALGLPEGTLKAYAQSGANGSQYVTNPAALAHPQAMTGVTYVDLPSGGTWQSMDWGNSSGILIVHNSDRNAILKNTNSGTFKGIVIVDDYVHSHNEIYGAVISLSTVPSSGNILGNGSGHIYYSTEAIGAAFSNWAGIKVVSWRDTSVQ